MLLRERVSYALFVIFSLFQVCLSGHIKKFYVNISSV